MKHRISVVDLETDPEDYNGEYLPFCVGFYQGYEFRYWFDAPHEMPGTCLERFVAHLSTLDRPHLIYAHNGGKFDFMFMLKYMDQRLHIQNSRIIQAWIGKHELRDSYSILPIKLADFKGKHEKKKFASRDEQTSWYRSTFNRRDRWKNKREIVSYLKDDCLTLYDGVVRFRDEFGDKLTIGSTSMSQLRKLHKFETGGPAYDASFRPYYFGGRNQCFRSGILTGEYKIFDVNSMYPYVMRSFLHPISVAHEINVKITKRTTFALIEAKNYGCLPVRTQTGLDFTREYGVFHASIHEIEAGLETGTLEIQRIKHTIEHKERATFAEFVDMFYAKRLSARAAGDEMLVILYKLILNSAYGKFAQNPENFKDYIITHDACAPEGWELDTASGDYFIWSKPSQQRLYFNVATAASITAAARAVLLRGLASANEPVYCDTDSIICKDLNLNIDPSQLGAWKPEGIGDSVAIAGKKLYVVYSAGNSIKQASKGALISADEIRSIARGGTVSITNPVPHFKMNGKHAYVSRRLRATAGELRPWTKPKQSPGTQQCGRLNSEGEDR